MKNSPVTQGSFNLLAKELAEESILLFGREKATGKQPLEYIMLMVTELAEAAECVRRDQEPIWVDEKGKPQGEAVELADVLMRLLNYCGHKGFDLDKAFSMKREYNMSKRMWQTEGKNI